MAKRRLSAKGTTLVASEPTMGTPPQPKPCIPSPILYNDFDDVAYSLVTHMVTAGDIFYAASLIQMNPILSQAVLRIRGAVQDVEIIPNVKESTAYKKEQKYWIDSLRAPWNGGTKQALLSRIAWNMCATGECFLRVTRGVAGATVDVIDRRQWSIVRVTGTFIPAYLMNAVKTRLPFPQWPESEDFDDFAVRIELADFLTGLPHAPLRATLEAREVFELIYQQARAILSNKPALSGVIAAENADQWDDPTMAAIEARLERFRTGGNKQGGILLVNGKVQSVQFDTNLGKILTPEARRDAASDISIGLGVPLELIGVGDTTFNNMSTARKLFYESTILPSYAEPICAAISAAVLPPYAGLVVDRDAIDALRTGALAAMGLLEPLTFLTIDEKRVASGFPAATPAQMKELLLQQQQQKAPGKNNDIPSSDR
jgi:phage portal protein BeeE